MRGFDWILVLLIACGAAIAIVAMSVDTSAQVAPTRDSRGNDCEPFAAITRCSGSAALYDETYCTSGERERITMERCLPEGWLRVQSIERFALVEERKSAK